jgi:hypothetical protein
MSGGYTVKNGSIRNTPEINPHRRIVRWALDTSDQLGYDRATHRTIAAIAGLAKGGRFATVSLPTLARVAGLSERDTVYGVNRLRLDGLVLVGCLSDPEGRSVTGVSPEGYPYGYAVDFALRCPKELLEEERQGGGV